MKKHICFAGFAEGEIDALQPSLATLGEAWECVFSPDAASALEALAAGPFDATVANLRPGGMDDSGLLHEAAIRHPRTLRIVLGDVADRELVVNSMGSAHQFISRPWKPRDLICIIERSLALDAWLSNDELRSFVPRLGKLPGMPATYFEVMKRAESPRSSVESIAEVIARDPALTARLLQMVNSPACGLTEKITSPAEAVSMLGLETVKSLVLCLQLFAQSSPTQVAGLSLDELWRHSFLVAKLAAKIVLRCMGNERMASDAYTAGLLHKIGQTVLATSLSSDYAAVIEAARKRKCPLQEVELEELGVTHNQVGAYLLGLWGMPLPLLEATALHHAPAAARSVEFSVLTAVHVANVLAHEETGKVNGLAMPKLDAEYLGTLELPRKVEAWRKLLAAGPPNVSGLEGKTELVSSSSAPAQTESSGRPGRNLLVAVAVVAAILAACWALRRNSPPLAHSSEPAATAETATAGTSGSEGAGTTPAVSVFDSIKVQGIVYSAGHPVALINGKALGVGDRIEGVEVVSIGVSKVVLARSGEQRTFKLK
jgi:HD-like signal output (HDOD) protein